MFAVKINPDIEILSVKQPESGAVFATYCPGCKTTVIEWDAFMERQPDDEMIVMKMACLEHLPPRVIRGTGYRN